jgi:hypothetical protein
MGRTLIELIDEKISQVRTTSLDISFNELLDMYQSEELIISPDYQRLFRWSEEKESRFIETLILELPLPPIFVIEIEEGKYELIDGLQRISTYLHFRGVLETKDEALKLIDCDIVPELNGLTYEEFPKSLQIKLKRNFIRVEVLRKESDVNLRYHMFKRLNSGGEILSAQEIRNCTIRILNQEINNFIVNLSEDTNFKNTISNISKDEIDKKRNEELVLRFFTLKNDLDNYIYPFDEYLTKYMENVAIGKSEFNYEIEKNIFVKTFKVLNKILGKDIFATQSSYRNYQSNFVQYLYDGLILGIQSYLDELDSFDDIEKLQTLFTEIKSNDEIYRKRTGSKSNIKTRAEIIHTMVETFINDN